MILVQGGYIYIFNFTFELRKVFTFKYFFFENFDCILVVIGGNAATH